MGLDMFLIAERNTRFDENDIVLHSPVGTRGKVIRIETEVMYWRKANAIHGWFVRNVQNGKDDCGKYQVSHSQVKHLLSDIALVLDNEGHEEIALKTLPPTEGCFFGQYTLDEYYWSDLRHTYDVLFDLDNDDEFWDYNDLFYQSSW
jgi:hypothetical protein